MVKFIIIFNLLLILFGSIIVLQTEAIPDNQTKLLCREYANRDHEKEIAPLRWKLNSHEWKDFDWYKSCIDHNTKHIK